MSGMFFFSSHFAFFGRINFYNRVLTCLLLIKLRITIRFIAHRSYERAFEPFSAPPLKPKTSARTKMIERRDESYGGGKAEARALAFVIESPFRPTTLRHSHNKTPPPPLPQSSPPLSPSPPPLRFTPFFCSQRTTPHRRCALDCLYYSTFESAQKSNASFFNAKRQNAAST